MKRVVVLLLVALACAATASCAKPAAVPQPSSGPVSPKVIWTGQSDGFVIRWTAGDITASRAKRTGVILSALGLTIVDFHATAAKQTSDCDFTRTTGIQSVVGPLISIADLDSMKCVTGQTGTGRKTVAFDLTRPKTPALLSQYFPESQLTEIRMGAQRVCPSIPSDLMSRFAFQSLADDRVAVELTLPADCSTPRLDVSLPVPAGLRNALVSAASRKEGFLLLDQPPGIGGQATTINYHYRTTNS